jgi:putative nucleotidyltransferase with HDIG domain
VLAFDQNRSSAHTFVEIKSSALLQQPRARLMSILSDGLPTLPSNIFELNTLLSASSVDLKRVGKVIRSDPSLSAQVLRLCNSAMFNLRRRVLSIEEAAILMGSERLRTLALTCSVMEFTGQALSNENVQTFWKHSFLTGMLSERIARWVEYSEPEQAYLGGLLHDIGTLPLLIVNGKAECPVDDFKDGKARDLLEVEREFFGMDHCEVGARIGQSWNFFPSFIDVFENHHHPELSSRDPYLVGIVAAADHFCEEHSTDTPGEEEAVTLSEAEPSSEDEFLVKCFPRLDAEDRTELTEMLETEYLHLLPAIEFHTPKEQPVAGRRS